jgi:hypothetical protein
MAQGASSPQVLSCIMHRVTPKGPSADSTASRSEVVPAPWHGRFWNYEERGGMLVPLDGEVAWLLPEGEKPYWRSHITEIHYDE